MIGPATNEGGQAVPQEVAGLFAPNARCGQAVSKGGELLKMHPLLR